MAPPQSDEQLVDDPAMVDITPPHPDEHFGGEPAVEETAPPRFSDEQQLGCVPQTTLMPYAAVDSSLRAMAGQAEGFGRH